MAFSHNDFQVSIEHVKIRWLSLYSSIERLLVVYRAVKDNFIDQSNDEIPKE